MGWYDLDDGRVYGEVQHEAEVRYSGRAYDALETERKARAQRGE